MRLAGTLHDMSVSHVSHVSALNASNLKSDTGGFIDTDIHTQMGGLAEWTEAAFTTAVLYEVSPPFLSHLCILLRNH